MKIYEWSASDLIQKIRAKEISVKKVAEAFISRIQEIHSSLNAIHQFDPVRILQEAELADLAIAQNKPLGKLHGLPITIKDTCMVAGFKVGRGYPYFVKQADKDATIISRLKAAGVIIMGITNVPELCAAYETDNRLNGRTNNPYDLTRTPGGSSGGEAAMIAAGGSVVGIGSDAGGSIRVPAHYCGISGHKPTQGLIPLTATSANLDGEAGILASMIVLGPMSRHVKDLSLMMEVISGADEGDPHTPPVKFENPNSVDVRKLRIAYYIENPDAPPSEETVNAVMKTVDILKSEGISVTHDYPKMLDDIYRLQWETFFLGGDKGAGLKKLFENFQDKELTPLLKQFLHNAENCEISLTQYRQNLVDAEILRYAMMQLNYDILISPVTSSPARKHGETFKFIHDFNYARTHNLTGWPATVIPISYSKEGLPIGIQIAAKPWKDHVSLATAQFLEEKLGADFILVLREMMKL